MSSGSEDHSDCDAPLDADPRRQAVDSTRGTVYQIWRSVFAWLDLAENEILYLEGAEDFDLVRDNEAETNQIKDTAGSGNKTLRSSDILSALENYLETVRRNPQRSIRFKFLTTSGVGIERGAPFGADRGGLHVWSACQLERQGGAAHDMAGTIRSFLLTLSNLPSSVGVFLGTADPSRVKSDLIDRIEWYCNEPGIGGVQEAIHEKLVYQCDRRRIHSSEASKVQAALFEEASTVVTQHENRFLTRARYLEIFDTVTALLVPRSELGTPPGVAAALALQPLSALAKAAGFTVDPVQFHGQQATLQIPSPTPPQSLKRDAVNKTLAQRLEKSGVLLLLGSTGMGKSTLSRMYAAADPERWLWLDCRGSDPRQMGRLMREASRDLAQDNASRNLIIDDVDFSCDTRHFDQPLLLLSFLIRERKGRLLVTGYNDAPPRILLNLGLGDEERLWVPAFNETDIDAYLLEQGCRDAALRQSWAKVIWLRTSGHPQLVNARIQSVKATAFRKPDVGDLLETPIDIQNARNEARQIIASDTDPDSRALLYRLSLLIAPFRRDRAIAIASAAPSIPVPGDAFDRLVGPWIERLEGGYYRSSPLVRQTGADANTPDWVTAMHRSIARAMLQFKSLTPHEASTILFHGLMGQDAQSLAHMSLGLINAKEELWPHLAGALDWFVYAAPHSEETSRLYSTFELFAIRMLQYRIASVAKPRTIGSLISAIDEEFPPASNDVMQLAMRTVLLGQILIRINVPLSVAETIKKGREVLLFQELIEKDERFAPLAEHIKESGASYAEMFAVVLLPRVKNLEDLADFCLQFRDMDDTISGQLLKALNDDQSMAIQLVNSVWLSEFRRADRRWPEVLRQLEELYDLAIGWKNHGLARAAAIIATKILDEGMSDPAGAKDFIYRSVSDTGVSPEQQDAEANVLFNQGDYGGALKAWEEALADWRPSRFGGALEIAFACRSAGIAAARLDNWQKAGDFFLHGTDAVQATGALNFRVGLLADAAYALWYHGDLPKSVCIFHNALQLMEDIPNTPDDIGNYSLHKTVGGVLTIIATQNRGANANSHLEPQPGMCSNPDPNEQIVNLNPTPIDFSWIQLVQLEVEAGERVVYTSMRRRLSTSPYALVRLSIADLEIRLCLKSGELSDYVLHVVAALKAWDTLRDRKEAGLEVWEPDEAPPVTPDTVRAVETASSYCLAGLLRLRSLGNNLADLLSGWRRAAVDADFGSEFVQWFEFLLSLSEAGVAEARSVLQSPRRKPFEQAAAAHFVAMNDASGPDDVMAAHLTLLTTVAASVPKTLFPLFEHDVASLIERDWRRIGGRRFLLRSPLTTAPAILAACGSNARGWVKCAEIILAAEPATRWRLPKNLVEILRRGGQ
ncbi:MAG: hypothetical protein ACYC9S_12950 [Leptospirales bacterium]